MPTDTGPAAAPWLPTTSEEHPWTRSGDELAYRRGDARPIIESLATAAFAAVANGQALTTDITSIATAWQLRVRARRDSSAHRLTSLLLRQPVVNIALVARELGISETAADSSVRALVSAGILVPSSSSRRNRHWQADEVLHALDRFGARARRARPGR